MRTRCGCRNPARKASAPPNWQNFSREQHPETTNGAATWDEEAAAPFSVSLVPGADPKRVGDQVDRQRRRNTAKITTTSNTITRMRMMNSMSALFPPRARANLGDGSHE